MQYNELAYQGKLSKVILWILLLRTVAPVLVVVRIKLCKSYSPTHIIDIMVIMEFVYDHSYDLAVVTMA